MKDWLVAQLPRSMAEDRVLRAFATGGEELGDSVRHRIDSIEHQLDVGLASPGMVRFLGAWLGLALDPVDETDVDGAGKAGVEYQRNLVRTVGRVLPWRGTRRGIEDLLEGLTGGRVTVRDSGGVFAPGETPPPLSQTVRVELETTGRLNEDQVRAYLAQELPVNAVLVIEVRHPKQPVEQRSGGE